MSRICGLAQPNLNLVYLYLQDGPEDLDPEELEARVKEKAQQREEKAKIAAEKARLKAEKKKLRCAPPNLPPFILFNLFSGKAAVLGMHAGCHAGCVVGCEAA